MKKLNCNISRICLLAVLLFALVGFCPAYGGQFQLISDSQEQQLGRETAKKVEAQYGVYRNPAWQSKIREIGGKVAEKSDRPGLPYSFKILNTKTVNAFAVPGGYIYVTKGLMDTGISEIELAGVLGHEIAHNAKRHSMRALERNLGIAVVLQLLTRGKSGTAKLSGQVIQTLLDRGYSREYEFEADNAGAFYAWKAGYNPWGLVFFLERLEKMQKGRDSSVTQLFSTHPPTKDRLSRLEVQMKDLKEKRPKKPKTSAVSSSSHSEPSTFGPDSSVKQSGNGTFAP